MAWREAVILLEKKQNHLYPNASKTPLSLIPSSLCIQSSYEIDEPKALLRAYQDKILSQDQNYLSFCFPLKIQNKTLCFFAPLCKIPKSKFAMLDLSLPTQIDREKICVLFVYSDFSLLCFYQNHTLEYCQTFTSASTLPSLKALFGYSSAIYCLAYVPIPKEFHSLSLLPLSSFFTSSPKDFSLHFESIPLQDAPPLLPLSPPTPSHHIPRFMLLTSLLCIVLTCIFCFLSPSPPQADTRPLQILSTLHSLPSNTPLFSLLQELEHISKQYPLLSIELCDNQVITLTFANPLPQSLLSSLASKEHIGKMVDSKTLEIGL